LFAAGSGRIAARSRRKRFRPPTAHPSSPPFPDVPTVTAIAETPQFITGLLAPEVRAADSGTIEQTESGNYTATTHLPSRRYFPGSFLGLD
ncbi:MAG: hypothetical protein WBW14_05340, partial [Candidatus Acidiferrum sp.]